MSDNILKLENISKNYGELKVLKNNSLNVKKGEVVCIIGPSGAGKSTLLRSINQLESVKNGKIWIDGELLVDKEKGKNKLNKTHKEIAKSLLEVGMVFQRFNLFPHIGQMSPFSVNLKFAILLTLKSLFKLAFIKW